jgi:hypothetical protein
LKAGHRSDFNEMSPESLLAIAWHRRLLMPALGAAIASTAGQLLRVRPAQLKTLLGCGVSAGIAAHDKSHMLHIGGAEKDIEALKSDMPTH